MPRKKKPLPAPDKAGTTEGPPGEGVRSVPLVEIPPGEEPQEEEAAEGRRETAAQEDAAAEAEAAGESPGEEPAQEEGKEEGKEKPKRKYVRKPKRALESTAIIWDAIDSLLRGEMTIQVPEGGISKGEKKALTDSGDALLEKRGEAMVNWLPEITFSVVLLSVFGPRIYHAIKTRKRRSDRGEEGRRKDESPPMDDPGK